MTNESFSSTAIIAYPPVYTMCHTIHSMSDIRVFEDKTKLAEAVAKQTITALRVAISEYGTATWVLAGGSTPQLAYEIIASQYSDALDWAAVTVLIGDERIGPLDGPDNNWHSIDQVIGKLPTIKFRPSSDLSAEEAATDYSEKLAKLPVADNGLPRLDVVWLGIGKDGHTLSLFPLHDSLLPSSRLVVPVYNSPKPPSDRISLSLRALQGAQSAFILSSGADKKDAVAAAHKGGSLPIALAASIIATHEGTVTWFVDKDAAPTD